MNVENSQIFRRVNEGSGMVLITTELVESAKITINELHKLRAVSFFYEGQGERVTLNIDHMSGWVSCIRVRSGYKTVVFNKCVSLGHGDILKLQFSSVWLEVLLNEKYVGSSYLESINEGYVRLDFLDQNVDSSLAINFEEVAVNYDSLFVGDGFTGGNWPHVSYWVWPDLICGGREKFINAGVSAANSFKALVVVKSIKSKIESKFSRAFLMLGVDDIIDLIERNEAESNYIEIVKCLEAISDRLYLCTLTPRQDEKNERINIFNDFIRRLATERDHVLIDVSLSFRGLVFDKHFYDKDYPNKDGQRVIAETVMKVLNIKMDSTSRVNLNVGRKGLPNFFMFLSDKCRGLAGRLS